VKNDKNTSRCNWVPHTQDVGTSTRIRPLGLSCLTDAHNSAIWIAHGYRARITIHTESAYSDLIKFMMEKIELQKEYTKNLHKKSTTGRKVESTLKEKSEAEEKDEKAPKEKDEAKKITQRIQMALQKLYK
jgi:hypothetical protein